MTVQHANSNISSESEDGASLPRERQTYRRKYQLLLERCEVLQQDNERILNRVLCADRIARRLRADRRLLARRLDRCGDRFPRSPSPDKKPPKRRPRPTERDPNAPKKPCNAFFQFCQQQRPRMMAAAALGGEQELTRRLAQQWRTLTQDDKRVYVAMFERSKEKYAEEMSMYNKKEQ